MNGALRGAGTRDGTLIRLIVTRCDVDLGSVKIEYEKMFGKRLQADVAVRYFPRPWLCSI